MRWAQNVRVWYGPEGNTAVDGVTSSFRERGCLQLNAPSLPGCLDACSAVCVSGAAARRHAGGARTTCSAVRGHSVRKAPCRRAGAWPPCSSASLKCSALVGSGFFQGQRAECLLGGRASAPAGAGSPDRRRRAVLLAHNGATLPRRRAVMGGVEAGVRRRVRAAARDKRPRSGARARHNCDGGMHF